MQDAGSESLGWYAARFASGYELPAAKLLDQDPTPYKAFCPAERRKWVNRGTTYVKPFPVIPGYTFVQLPDYFAYRWHDVANTKGYLGFIGGGEPQRESILS
jgi:transcription antitermination factor NusG